MRDRAIRDSFEAALHKAEPHLVIFSRYGGPIPSQMLKIAREAKLPIVAHFDDDLLGVPPELGPDKYRRYNDPARLSAIRTVLQESDVIYASTPALAERLRERGIGVPILAGTIYCSGEPMPDVLHNEPPVVGYMGSGGHAHDLAIALPGVIRLLTTRPNMRFELFGTIPMPDSLRSFGARVTHHPFNSDYEAFLRQLGKLGWSVGLAPLADIPFNTVKANTKWVEYTSAGIAVIASDHPVYRTSCAMDCGILAKDDGWFDAMTHLLDNTSEREEMTARARRKLEREFNPERLRLQLLSVFARAGATVPITVPRLQVPRLS
jgi:glycosyltransferase involved in cell wall biosynthesis